MSALKHKEVLLVELENATVHVFHDTVGEPVTLIFRTPFANPDDEDIFSEIYTTELPQIQKAYNDYLEKYKGEAEAEAVSED